MKSIQLPKHVAPFLVVAKTAKTDTLVFTENKKPVAALVSLRNVDPESLALSTNPQFLEIVERARKEIRAGKTISLESIEKKFGLAGQKNGERRPAKAAAVCHDTSSCAVGSF